MSFYCCSNTLNQRWGAFRIGHHRINLHQGAGGQLAHANHGAGGQIGREVFGVDGIHVRQIRDVLHLDIDLDDIVHHVADALDDGLDMAETLGGLLLDATGQDLAGGQINRQLAGDVVVVGEGDSLGVQGASRRLVGIVGADHQIVFILNNSSNLYICIN